MTLPHSRRRIYLILRRTLCVCHRDMGQHTRHTRWSMNVRLKNARHGNRARVLRWNAMLLNYAQYSTRLEPLSAGLWIRCYSMKTPTSQKDAPKK